MTIDSALGTQIFGSIFDWLNGNTSADHLQVLCFAEVFVPDDLGKLSVTQMSPNLDNPDSIETDLLGLDFRPDWVIGTNQTNALALLLVQRKFPKISILCGTGNTWWSMIPAALDADCVQKVLCSKIIVSSCVEPRATELGIKLGGQLVDASSFVQSAPFVQHGQIPSQSMCSLIYKLFCFCTYEDQNDEQKIAIDRLKEQLRQRVAEDTNVGQNIISAEKDGLRARLVLNDLINVCNKEGFAVARQRLNDMKRTINARIFGFVKLKLDKNYEFIKNKQAQAREQKVPRKAPPVLKPVHFTGHHPNSVRHLNPSDHWIIAIDETGSTFDERADDLALTSTHLGRVVALVVPEHTKLPGLQPKFHAVDQTDDTLDRVVETILQSPVGVFGYTVKDRVREGKLWINHIRQLILWVLIQLPKSPSCTVEVFIEGRGEYKASESIKAMGDIIIGELKEVDPERFFQFKLYCNIVNKNQNTHPHLGYVDAIAHTWGGSSAKDRLKKTKWEQHCLIRPDKEQMERLYMDIIGSSMLQPEDWYKICAAQLDEPDHGLLHDTLKQVGLKVSQTTWLSYLQYVQNKISIKNFQLNALGMALEWLNVNQKSDQWLPASARLQLASAHLSLANHRGHLDRDLVKSCISLSWQLKEEMAPACCEVSLRVASLCINYFDFECASPDLKRWLSQPAATVGTLNYGKLHSAMGQIHAFMNQTAEAIQWFDKAIDIFNRLSDPIQKSRECAQTTTYRLISLLDTPTMDHHEVCAAVAEHLKKRMSSDLLPKLIRALACGDHQTQYEHHLFLRTLFSLPEETREWADIYWSHKDIWDDTELSHPWPLIYAYRGWLAQCYGDHAEASLQLEYAVMACFDVECAPTMHWIGLVLQAFARQFGIQIHVDDTRMPRLEQVVVHFQQPPMQELNQLSIAPDVLLKKCLPFNFH